MATQFSVAAQNCFYLLRSSQLARPFEMAMLFHFIPMETEGFLLIILGCFLFNSGDMFGRTVKLCEQ